MRPASTFSIIQLSNSRVSTDGLACINRCPAEAIQYADKSQTAFRYTFGKYFKLAQSQ